MVRLSFEHIIFQKLKVRKGVGLGKGVNLVKMIFLKKIPISTCRTICVIYFPGNSKELPSEEIF